MHRCIFSFFFDLNFFSSSFFSCFLWDSPDLLDRSLQTYQNFYFPGYLLKRYKGSQSRDAQHCKVAYRWRFWNFAEFPRKSSNRIFDMFKDYCQEGTGILKEKKEKRILRELTGIRKVSSKRKGRKMTIHMHDASINRCMACIPHVFICVYFYWFLGCYLVVCSFVLCKFNLLIGHLFFVLDFVSVCSFLLSLYLCGWLMFVC